MNLNHVPGIRPAARAQCSSPNRQQVGLSAHKIQTFISHSITLSISALFSVWSSVGTSRFSYLTQYFPHWHLHRSSTSQMKILLINEESSEVLLILTAVDGE